jgi:Tfp pilus assembly protein FimT
MTLIEVVVVVVIIAITASGLSFSFNALARTNLKGGAGKLAAAARYAYNRAVIQGTTVRIGFAVPGNTFSIEEAHGKVTLARVEDERRKDSLEEGGSEVVAVDPWAAARNRIEQALKPTLGATPFGPITSSTGQAIARYTDVALGRRVQIVKLIVPHQPAPLEQGKGGVHFFPGGMTEHAVLQLSDGGDTVYSVEIHPLTGRARVYPKAYEPDQLLGNPEDPDVSEVDL